MKIRSAFGILETDSVDDEIKFFRAEMAQYVEMKFHFPPGVNSISINWLCCLTLFRMVLKEASLAPLSSDLVRAATTKAPLPRSFPEQIPIFFYLPNSGESATKKSISCSGMVNNQTTKPLMIIDNLFLFFFPQETTR